jgi:hypothetical protein
MNWLAVGGHDWTPRIWSSDGAERATLNGHKAREGG